MSGPESDVDLALSLLAQAGADLRSAFERFAAAAAAAWPDVVSSERSGFFSRGPIHRVTFRLPGRAYIVRREGAGLAYEVGSMAHGVVVRVDAVAPASWAAGLRDDIDRATADTYHAQGLFGEGLFPPAQGYPPGPGQPPIPLDPPDPSKGQSR
jgi:hypothetical protein